MPVEHCVPGLEELERLGQRQLRYTVHEEMGHEVWRRVFGGEHLDWLLSHPWGE